jgi:hypothetical protein
MARTNRKILNLVGRILLAAATIIGGAVAKAEYCRIDCTSIGANSPWRAIGHVNGASEGHDSKDAAFLQSPASPRIDFYSKVPLSPPYDDKLMVDARGPNSTTCFDLRIEGAEIPETIDANLSFRILDDGQGNFDWKNLIAKLYNGGDVNDCNNLIASYDIKDLVTYGQKIPLTISNGLSYQLLIKPYNYADLDFNGKINWKDFAKFSLYWKTEGHDPNDVWADYADIDRSGSADYNDLSIFSHEWLWDADDPNTW